MTIPKLYCKKYVFLLLKPNCRFCFENDMKDTGLSYWTTKPNCFLVATSEAQPHQIFGCGGYKPLDQNTIEVTRLQVARKARRLGVAKHLMKRLFQHAKGNGYTTVYLNTINSQVPAIKMYHKMGFQMLRKTWYLEGLSKYLLPFSGLQQFHFLHDLKDVSI